jgi:hypothetical protein
METIIVTPTGKKELSLVKLFLEQVKIKFHTEERVENPEDKVTFTKEEYWEKIDRAMKSKGRPITEEYLKSLLV